MIDTHTHLYSEEFDSDRDLVIERAIYAGVKKFYLPAIDSTYTERMLSLKRQYPDIVFLMNGLHPCSVGENYREELAWVDELALRHSFSAIGEIGIDLYWDKTYLRQQQEAFSHQIKLAKKLSLPIVIHGRDAFDEIFEILEGEKGDDLFGIFHCFSGDLTQAYRAIDLGMSLGIGGVVTYKNARIDKFLCQVPLDKIVLETDSPYLSPVPLRGKRNESGNLTFVVYKLSEIYNLPTAKIIEQTTINAESIFKNQ